ncbi:hypothetical protein [Nocardia sp. NBC_01009]|uniref:hypothetical protein n=1 Tax=Nocardia sp. NBC_01009 TaxID=2975996 RepID=UPI00386851F3|nr:hypothetical protein OHA42_27785 [Nocardia sp. NBC_01009]
MDVRFISDDGVRAYPATDLKRLLDRPDGLVWVDVPTWDDEAAHALTNIFGFHPLAIRDSRHERDRERTNPMDLASPGPARDARDIDGPAHLGETQRLVLT